MRAKEIINKYPSMPSWVAEEMIWLEHATGKPYGEVMNNLIEKYGSISIFELLTK